LRACPPSRPARVPARGAGSGREGHRLKSFERKKPMRAPLPSHLPRERVVVAVACVACDLANNLLNSDRGAWCTRRLLRSTKWSMALSTRSAGTWRSKENL
jgi:hypothetical protein